MNLPSDPRYLHGIALFNQQHFFECHEVLEEVWTPIRGPHRFFLQALIHIAVGFYHHQRGNRPGAERQLRKGLRKLAGYLPEYEGVETGNLYREVVEGLEQIMAGGFSRYPEITLSVPKQESASE